jgi:iron complex outermembrane receptor protein
VKSSPLVDVNDNVVTAAVDITGNKLPQAPEQKVAINASYTFDWDPGSLTLGATYLYRSKSYANVFTREYNMAPSWDQVDLRAYWQPNGGKYTVIAYVKNLFDTEGYAAAVAGSQRNAPLLQGAQTLELTPPRIFGMELQYRF